MKRSLALAVCGFSLVLALVGGWLADRQFTAALDTLADQAVLQHQRNLFGYADTLQEVKADDSPHMILADAAVPAISTPAIKPLPGSCILTASG